jgi:hypothetical protein
MLYKPSILKLITSGPFILCRLRFKTIPFGRFGVGGMHCVHGS